MEATQETPALTLRGCNNGFLVMGAATSQAGYSLSLPWRISYGYTQENFTVIINMQS